MDAPWTAVYNTPNKSVRQNVVRRGVVLHHAAMTSLSGLRDMEVNGTKQVSSTAICKDDQLELIVPDNNYRPWSLSSAYWDSAMRSVETCNESTTGWTISDRSHWSLARAVAYWATTDGFWPHRDGDPKSWTVIGHREVYSIHGASYATACPGGMDLGLVTARAQNILSSTAGGGYTPIEEDDMYDEAARAEVVGRLDELIGKVNDLQAWKQSGANAARPRVYYRPDGLAVAIDVDEGFVRKYGSGAELANDRRLGLVSSDAAAVTDAELDALIVQAENRLAELQR